MMIRNGNEKCRFLFIRELCFSVFLSYFHFVQLCKRKSVLFIANQVSVANVPARRADFVFHYKQVLSLCTHIGFDQHGEINSIPDPATFQV